jgi:pimeloyl-ACP methyl ester carboxylesterase
VHRALTSNVLSTGELSNPTVIALHRRNLTETYRADPVATMRTLHSELEAGRLSHDDLFVLAELSYQYGSGEGGKPYFLAAAIYAYAFVFPDDPQAAPQPFDPRQRVAMDIYNRALAESFKSADREHVDVAAGAYPLPFGVMEISFDERQLDWGRRRLVHFSPSAEVEVIGFNNRYRQPGIGAPLAASIKPLDQNEPARDYIGANVHVPVTALLRIEGPNRQLAGTQLTGQLELYPATEALTTHIDGQNVPLEQEPTAALALSVAAAQPWTQELGIFLGRVLQIESAPSLIGREPHRRGRIPLVFVHGTGSNPSVWLNMINDLDSDPAIRQHFEVLLFRYDSGQPILYSGMQLRRALSELAQALQADGPDPCVDKMVVVGHSQGGLLVKLTAIHSGDLFWRNVSDDPFDEVELPDQTRALLKEVMFLEPLPFVNRVVFIATPQRGSYLAGPDLVRRLAQRLITLPASVVRGGADLLTNDQVRRKTRLQRMPTSIDNMSPSQPFILTVSKIPVAPEVTAHSIIGLVPGESEDSGGDGVVKFASAHIDGVESELVVPYPHSMQSTPEVVAEVERILHQHLSVNPCQESQPDR